MQNTSSLTTISIGKSTKKVECQNLFSKKVFTNQD